jgi:NAD(P)H-nitrite reductase large subunit
MPTSKYEFLIVGNSTAAIGAIEAIRKFNKTASIGVVASETEHTYSRPLITYFLAGKVDEDNVYYRPKDFYARNNVECILGKAVKSVNNKANQVFLDDGSSLEYDNLLLAAGGSPISPPLPGIDRPGVFFMNTMDDARKAKGWLSHTKKAVVVGAGLTGLKTAEALYYLGVEVTIVELADRVLAANMDEISSEMVRKVISEHKIEILTGVQLTAIEGSEDSNDTAFAVLNTGEKIACESVFMTIGVKPRIDIVMGSDVKVDRGILVDKSMRTNISNIYAAGDIAQAWDPLTSSNRVLPILPNAYIGGRVAGMNMIGKDSKYNAGMSVNSVNFFGEPFMSAGFAAQDESDDFIVFVKNDEKGYRKFVTKDNKLVGMILTGDVERAGILTGIMRAEISIADMEENLLDGEPSLICLPKEVLEERIHSSGSNWC